MGDRVYHFVVGGLKLFKRQYDLIGKENLPQTGPAVFIANHLDSSGPVACCCSIPLRMHLWGMADLLDPGKASAVMTSYFTEKELHLKPPLSTWFSYLLTRITVPLLRSLDCIPAFRGEAGRQETLRLSIKVLRQNKFLLIFPYNPSMQRDEANGIEPFRPTFTRLGEMYYAETGECLRFYPVAIHTHGYLMVGKPAIFNPLNPVGLEQQRLKDLTENTVRAMYMQQEMNKQLEGGNLSGSRTVKRMKNSIRSLDDTR